MNEYWQAVLLGNSAILGNVCMLPLYPSFLAYVSADESTAEAASGIAEEASHESRGGTSNGTSNVDVGNGNVAAADRVADVPNKSGGGTTLKRGGGTTRLINKALLGFAVLGGVLTSLIVIAGLFYLLDSAISDQLSWMLPLSFALIAGLGVAMIAGRNPMARLRSPSYRAKRGSGKLGAYLFGLLIGPITLPCTGPIIVSAFVLGGVSGFGSFVDQLTYFLAFGAGFGWPLVVLSLIGSSLQRRFTKLVTNNHLLITRISGALLIVMAIYGYLRSR